MTKPQSPRASLCAGSLRTPWISLPLVVGTVTLCFVVVSRNVRADPPISIPAPPESGTHSTPAATAGTAPVNRAAPYDRNALLGRGGYLARTALSYRGLPYRWGGTSARSGFDCSGLVQTVCAKWGIYLPRCASEQIHRGIPVKPDQLQAGDLVFFKNTYKRGLSHVGIYVGNGWFIHAAGRRWGVTLSRLDRGYHKKHWYGARRLNLSKLPPAPDEARNVVKSITVEDGDKETTVPMPSQPMPAASAGDPPHPEVYGPPKP